MEVSQNRSLLLDLMLLEAIYKKQQPSGRAGAHFGQAHWQNEGAYAAWLRIYQH